MRDAQAAMLDSLLKALEDRRLVRLVIAEAPTEETDGERADVSWITTEEVDRENEIVVAPGMNDSQFKLNPIVINNHAYGCAPVGKSLWRERAKDGSLIGIKAKTVYPKHPDSWTGDDWMPDTVLAHPGRHDAGQERRLYPAEVTGRQQPQGRRQPDLAKVSRVIGECLLIEYACTFLPMNQALMERGQQERHRARAVADARHRAAPAQRRAGIPDHAVHAGN